jgi:hypothetical protein
MPTALEKPAPRGPVVVSTPGRQPTSGCPGVREPSWRNFCRSAVVTPKPYRCSMTYSSEEPWPADSTNRSRSGQSGCAGSIFIRSWNSVYAMGAAPSGRPGWPDFAFSMVSAASMRMVWRVFSVVGCMESPGS